VLHVNCIIFALMILIYIKLNQLVVDVSQVQVLSELIIRVVIFSQEVFHGLMEHQYILDIDQI
jgi:hypothetical protein